MHDLVHPDKVEDGGCVRAAVLLVTDVTNCFEEGDAIL